MWCSEFFLLRSYEWRNVSCIQIATICKAHTRAVGFRAITIRLGAHQVCSGELRITLQGRSVSQVAFTRVAPHLVVLSVFLMYCNKISLICAKRPSDAVLITKHNLLVIFERAISKSNRNSVCFRTTGLIFLQTTKQDHRHIHHPEQELTKVSSGCTLERFDHPSFCQVLPRSSSQFPLKNFGE